MTDDDAMNRAIEICRVGIHEGNAPFGAVVVDPDGFVVAECHNSVRRDRDPSAHAEINAIRVACDRLSTDRLVGSTIFSTCEPCPMCMAAILWSGLDRVVFGSMMSDAELAGLTQLPIDSGRIAEMAARPISIVEGFLRGECCALFAEWQLKQHA